MHRIFLIFIFALSGCGTMVSKTPLDGIELKPASPNVTRQVQLRSFQCYPAVESPGYYCSTTFTAEQLEERLKAARPSWKTRIGGVADPAFETSLWPTSIRNEVNFPAATNGSEWTLDYIELLPTKPSPWSFEPVLFFISGATLGLIPAYSRSDITLLVKVTSPNGDSRPVSTVNDAKSVVLWLPAILWAPPVWKAQNVVAEPRVRHALQESLKVIDAGVVETTPGEPMD